MNKKNSGLKIVFLWKGGGPYILWAWILLKTMEGLEVKMV